MDPMTRAMYGQNAIHVPLNLIVQNMGEGKVTGVFQTTAGLPMMFGSIMTHQLIMGDVIIRPHLVMETNALRGAGFSALARDGFQNVEEWMNGNVLLDPMGRLKELTNAAENR